MRRRDPIYEEILQALPQYKTDNNQMRAMYGRAYYGAGFIYKNPDLMTDDNRFDSYDINSAFISNFTTQVFPLSTTDVDVYDGKEIDINDFNPKHKHYIVGIKLYGRLQKYQGDYSKYLLSINNKSGLHWSKKDKCLVGWICDCDLEILQLLYTWKRLTIVKYIGFNQCGKLSDAAKVVLKYYNQRREILDSSEKAAFKQRINKCCYGKLAYGNDYQGAIKGDVRREPHCVVAMYEIAYTRLRMAKLLAKYHDKVVYIDSDSIRVLSGTRIDSKDIEIGDGLGQFKCEWSNRRVYFIAAKQYIVYDEDDMGYECHICRISDPLTQEQIDSLRQGQSIILQAKYKDKTIPFTICDSLHYPENYNLRRLFKNEEI